jgi:hypothetical protein
VPVIMIGVRRSGSNLLRVMLNEAPGIVAPHPPHILMRLMPLLPVYGDLTRPANFEVLVDDVCRLVELNPVPWEGVTLERGEIIKRCRKPSLVDVYGAVYDLAMETWGARDWVCKSVENVLYVEQIEASFTAPKYVYLYRDGRDVAVSMRKAIIGEKHMYHMAREWAHIQRVALAHRAKIPAQRFLSVSYEDLTMKSEETVRRLCAFLEVPYSERMLEFHKSDESKRTAEKSSNLWGNVAKPLMANNTRKFLREASELDLNIFESVAGDVLDALGYERVAVRRGEEHQFSPEEISLFDKENDYLKQAVLQGLDNEERDRRDRQDALLTEIRERRHSA